MLDEALVRVVDGIEVSVSTVFNSSHWLERRKDEALLGLSFDAFSFL